MGTAMAVLLARAGLEVQLGCRTPSQAARLIAERENAALPARRRARRGDRATTVRDIEFAGVDLVVLAVPCCGLPAALGEIGALIGDRSAVLVPSKGLVPPLGTTPDRLRGRARPAPAPSPPGRPRARARGGRGGRLGGARHPRPRPAPPAGRRARGRRPERGDHRRRDRRRAGRLRQERRGAGRGRRRGRAAPTSPAPPPGACSPRCTSWRVRERRPQRDLRRPGRRGRPGRHRDGRGQPQPPRRRAGGRRACRPARSRPASRQTAEALAAVPLLDARRSRARASTPRSPTGLRTLLEGEASAGEWLESVRSASPKRRTPCRLTARAARG